MPRPCRLLPLLLALGLAASARAAEPTLDIDGIRPGQKALVRTVFEGQRVETFEAEIVGVFHGGRVDGNIIVGRATSERVVRSGIAQGMSGSPVYVDGRLVGALSGAWTFSREPLFVITPIRDMLAVLDQPEAGEPGGPGTAGPSGLEPTASAAFGDFRWPGADTAPSLPEPTAWSQAGIEAAGGMPRRLSVPLSCAGLDPALFPAARQAFESLGFTAVPAARGGAEETVAALEPGSAIAVELMRGDLHIAATGTLTWRDGDRILIFGHPFFQSGRVRLPLAAASITTIVSSSLISFKLGTPLGSVGTATQDRRAAVAGVLGPPPALMPVGVTIRAAGRPDRHFRFESIEDRALAPQLVAVASVNSLLESGGTAPGQTVRWSATYFRRGAPPLTVSDVAAGESLIGELVNSMAAPTRFLFNNPFTPLHLDSIAVRLDTHPGRDLWWLRAARLLDGRVRPGGTVRVRCDLEAWRGGVEQVDLQLSVPADVPAGDYVLWLGGAGEWSRFEASKLPGRYRPGSLDEAWSRLGEYRGSNHLRAALLGRAPEITRDGRDYPELPTSALSILAGRERAEDASRRGSQATLDALWREYAGQVRGELQLYVNVDPLAP